MIKANFRELTIDQRVMAIKQFSKDFFLFDFQTQAILTIQNPVIKIYKDAVCDFHSVNELNEFYFIAQSFIYES
jgi:hypothetical protein